MRHFSQRSQNSPAFIPEQIQTYLVIYISLILLGAKSNPTVCGQFKKLSWRWLKLRMMLIELYALKGNSFPSNNIKVFGLSIVRGCERYNTDLLSLSWLVVGKAKDWVHVVGSFWNGSQWSQFPGFIALMCELDLVTCY